MGYRPKRKVFRLVFEDEDMAGLEVVMRSVSVDSLLRMAALADSVQGGSGGGGQVEDLFARFARALESWNVEDDEGRPVPATLDGVKSQDADFVVAVFSAWFEAMTSPNPPKPPPSNGGGTWPAASLPMVPLSPSRPS